MSDKGTAYSMMEKIHEEMITASDSFYTIDLGKYYAILSAGAKKHKYLEHFNATEVEKGFQYNSGKNDQWVSVEEMRELIRTYVYPDFKPLES